MKKLGYLMVALACAMLVACSSCKPSEGDATPIEKEPDFNEALLKINLEVLKKYPAAQFYEAQGFLIVKEGKTEVDGTVDVGHFKVAYNYMDADRQKTIIGTFDENRMVKVEVVNDIWVEDIITTPYVAMTAQDAINILNSSLDEKVGTGPITLRHQLFPGEAEPRYFLGTINAVHTVNVYTGKVDVPVEAKKDSVVVK